MGGMAVTGTLATAGLVWMLASSDVLIWMRALGHDMAEGACSGSCGQAAAIASPPVSMPSGSSEWGTMEWGNDVWGG